jgi:MFS family permease
MIAPGCKLECAIEDTLPFDNYKNMCSTKEGDTRLTLALYFVFRALATMCLACCFILIDAQTIQMCKEEELNGRKGALGKQYVFQAISQAIISPVIGQLMDLVSKTYNDGQPNYLVPFISHDVFLLVGMVLLIFTDLNVQLPKSTGFKGMKKIFSSLDVCVFLVLMFVIGSLWGFIETFLFVYLKDDMSAPMYLLGLTITVGAVVSIPFLYIADYLVDRIGRNNTFIIALLMYSVRYVGYSYITNPWHAFPFEALELFTINLFKVACVQYVGEKSPPGLLATLNGISGCIHYGLGKGSFLNIIFTFLQGQVYDLNP